MPHPARFVFSAFAAGLALAFVPLASSEPAPLAFRSGDRWSAVGDSITHHGSYYAWIYLYELTRFPKQELTVENCAISGDSAAGTVARYDWDIRPTTPTIATVMLGMNDVDRNAYSDTPPTTEILTRRRDALDRYRKSMEELVGQLQRDHARIILLTPSPFDETVVGARESNHSGVSQALAECAALMRDLAEKKNVGLIDFQKPMLDLTGQLQARDARATLIGGDRVHPGIPGHFVMAYLFLHAQNAPAEVARIQVDARTASTKADHATVDQLQARNDRLEFDCLEDALPYPIPEEAKPALGWVPFDKELNQEMLQISGLKPGDYTLTIDGDNVGTFGADVFQKGLNLAELPETPQLRQAREVLTLVRNWQDLVSNTQRTLATVEHWRLRGQPHPVKLDDVRSYLLTEYDRLRQSDEPNRKWDLLDIQQYLVLKPQQDSLQRELDALQTRLHVAAQPQPHHFQITSAAQK